MAIAVEELEDTAEKHVISIMSMGGDTKIKWDPTKAAEVDNARRTFSDLRQRGYTAHRKDGSGISEFDPQAKTMTMVPPMVGG